MDKVMLDIQKLTLGYDCSKPPVVSNLYFQLLKGETLCLHAPADVGKVRLYGQLWENFPELVDFQKGRFYMKEKIF